MTKKVAVFGGMGVKFAPIIEEQFTAKQKDWQVATWACDGDEAARDAVLAECEAAVMSADFILTPGNFGALMAAPNLKILLQPWVGTDWLDAGFLPKGLIFCNAGGHAAPMAEYVLGTMLEHALELRAMHNDMLAGKMAARRSQCGARSTARRFARQTCRHCRLWRDCQSGGQPRRRFRHERVGRGALQTRRSPYPA